MHTPSSLYHPSSLSHTHQGSILHHFLLFHPFSVLPLTYCALNACLISCLWPHCNFFFPFVTILLLLSFIAIPFSLWSLTYLFGADIVVFMRAASPAAAEGRPHNLALVAALGLVGRTDIWTKTNKETP